MMTNARTAVDETAEHHFLSMGSHAQVVVVGSEPVELATRAEERLAQLEGRWSRFLPDSDVARLNQSGDDAVVVSPDTFELLELAMAAWEVTDGLFDPSVLPAMVAAGYDRSFHLLGAGHPPQPRQQPPTPTPGCDAVELHAPDRSVRTPDDVLLDLGGLGKGHAADVVAAELIVGGASGALVDLGGDIRVAGEGPDGGAWTVGVEHPYDGSLITTLALGDAGVATSTTTVHRWEGPDADAHHLIDPATGAPAQSDIVAVTVIAADAAWAEVMAKAALIAGTTGGPELIGRFGLTGLLVLTDGTVWTLPGLDDHIA
jgi:thiamine biosynthesis lipoprotein